MSTDRDMGNFTAAKDYSTPTAILMSIAVAALDSANLALETKPWRTVRHSAGVHDNQKTPGCSQIKNVPSFICASNRNLFCRRNRQTGIWSKQPRSLRWYEKGLIRRGGWSNDHWYLSYSLSSTASTSCIENANRGGINYAGCSRPSVTTHFGLPVQISWSRLFMPSIVLIMPFN